jgi:multidrug efflux pump subunit AcrA (membrane-fusion protein)
MKSNRKALWLAIGGVAAAFALLILIKGLQIFTMMKMPHEMPATTVTSAPVKEEDWAPVLSAVGSLSSVQGAVVSTELGGIVSEVMFQNGGIAKKGDVLMKLDTSSEIAQLKTAEADLELAKANLDRARDLTNRKVISKQELDAAESAFGQKQGTVDNMRSFIGKKEVRAPFDGQLGIRYVNVGQMIKTDDQVDVLQTLDRVYAGFCVAAAGTLETFHRIRGSGAYRHGFRPRIQRQTYRHQLNGRPGYAKRGLASNTRQPRSRIAVGNVRESRSRTAGKTEDDGRAWLGDFLRALWRFGFCDRKKEG